MRMTCLSVQLLLERALGPGLCLARYEPTVKVSTLRNLTAGSTAFTCSIGPVVLKGVPAAVCQMQYQRANESCETGPAGDFAESRYECRPLQEPNCLFAIHRDALHVPQQRGGSDPETITRRHGVRYGR